jgi:flagellar hook-associated protein 1 FlgK
MSGLFGSLNQTVRALNAHSRSVEAAGRNLANVNNDSYARQRVLYADRGTVATPQGAQSLGIEAKGIQQMRDVFLDQQLVRQIGYSAALSAQDSTLAKAQAALGESINRTVGADDITASAHGMSASITDFFNAFQAFAGRPTDQGEKQNLIQRAEILADRFNETDRRLDQLQGDINQEIKADVDEINRLLESIAVLNSQVGRFEINANGSAVDLRDQRQAQIEVLAGKLAIETRPHATEAGQLDIFVKDATGAPLVLVGLATVTNRVAIDGSQLTAGSSATPIALTGGSVRGRLQARDGTVQSLRNGLDQMANQLAVAVNRAYNPTGGTGDFFDITPAAASASIRKRPGITATTLKASDGGSAGDNTLALAVVELSTRKFSVAGGDSIDGTFSQYYSGMVSDLGQAVSGTASRLEDQTNIERLVYAQRQGISGVSLDEEMADMIKFQRAFQASSRVINLIDSLLDLVVNRLGA